jgi:histone deacetylase 11
VRNPAIYKAALASMGFCLVGCFAPRSFKQVETSRTGRPLNQRVCVVYSSRYQIKLGGFERLHPFDINKYAKIYQQLQTDGYLRPEDVYVPEKIERRNLLTVHTEEYLHELAHDREALSEYLEFGPALLIAPRFVDRTVTQAFQYATGGTLLAARLALDHGIGVNIGGGYHHAGPESGGGFCIYADMPIAIRCLQRDGLIEQALVVDVDAHQGDGTADAFDGYDSVFTFSMHQYGIYPYDSGDSDLDIGLDAGFGDGRFLEILESNLPSVIDRSDPDIIFLQAGVDTLKDDPLSDLAMTEEGVIRRDSYVIDQAVSRGIPIVICLGGGYSKHAWRAQYRSIKTIIDRYGLVDGRTAHPPRRPSLNEKLYTK